MSDNKMAWAMADEDRRFCISLLVLIGRKVARRVIQRWGNSNGYSIRFVGCGRGTWPAPVGEDIPHDPRSWAESELGCLHPDEALTVVSAWARIVGLVAKVERKKRSQQYS
jgi:hypothetical protein